MEEYSVAIQLEGRDADDGHVRFDVFLGELQAMKSLVKAVEEDAASGEPTHVGVRVIDLRHSSPAEIAVDLVQLRPGRDVRPRMMEYLAAAATALEDPSSFQRLPVRTAEALNALASPVAQKSLPRVALRVAKRIVTITQEGAAAISQAMAITEQADGTFVGHLLAINLHGGDQRFTIYPARGPKSLVCHFPKGLTEEAIAAIDRRVEVEGSLRYRPRAPFPHEVRVKSIRPLPPLENLPGWEEMRGAMPDVTGPESSEDFVRRLRDEW